MFAKRYKGTVVLGLLLNLAAMRPIQAQEEQPTLQENPEITVNKEALVNHTFLPMVTSNTPSAESTVTESAPAESTPAENEIVQAAANIYLYTVLNNPTRTQVSDRLGLVATFTNNARTVSLRGPSRTFTETSFSATFTSTTWVRILPVPFNGTVDQTWLDNALQNRSPDIIAISMQYLEHSPALYSGTLKIAGNANYGPLDANGNYLEGSDFNDYLGITQTYTTVVNNVPQVYNDAPESDQINSLDCSGFMRMIWGYRGGISLSLDPNGGASMPRKSFQILDSAPGLVITQTTTQLTDFSKLLVGDLVFFDADPDDGTQIDHVGMYIGLDVNGKYRFISSRKTLNGPTFGTDYTGQGGKSILNGATYFWAQAFRAIRRL